MARKTKKFQPTRNGEYIGKDAPYETQGEAQAVIEADKFFHREALKAGWITPRGFEQTFWDIVSV